MKIRKWMLSLVAVLGTGMALAQEQPSSVYSREDLVSETRTVAPGQSFWVAVRFHLNPGVHTYWTNPGDSGLPLKLAWELPAGFSAGPLLCPYPGRIVQEGLVAFGYEREVWFLTRISAPATLAPGKVPVAVRVTGLVCRETCIPVSERLAVELDAASAPAAPDPGVAPQFARARALLPADAVEGWRFQASRVGAGLRLAGQRNGPGAVPPGVQFFPEEAQVLDLQAAQGFSAQSDGFALMLIPVAEFAGKTRLAGLLVCPGGWNGPGSPEAVRVVLPLAPAAGSVPASSAGTSGVSGGADLGLLMAVVFAFVGGLILNLMPCVFPILSIKILGFVRQAGEDRRRVRLHGLVFMAGVVVSFWALAGVLLALRGGGAQLGWGFQLQSPRFVLLLIDLFFLMGLWLLGVYEFGGALMSVGGQFAGRTGLGGAFSSGVLATMVATPCSAPFMGSALGFALTQPAWVSLAVFTAMGLGMSLPYGVLSFFPALLRFIPRPGPWMESFKQFLGFLLMASVVWLLWVLGALVDADRLAGVWLCLLLLAAGAWVYGRWGDPARRRWVRRAAEAAFLAALASAVLATGPLSRGAPAAGTEKKASGDWEPYSDARLGELMASGRPVLLDFSARWCLTCQANERFVLESGRVSEALRRLGVATVRADWTAQSPEITQALARYGRSSVPLYVLYGRDKSRPPAILPEVLDARIVLDALDRMDR